MRNILFSVMILSGLFIKAQEQKSKPKNEIDFSFYSTDIGNNLSLEFNKNIKKHTFIIGLKCHLNHYIKPTGPSGYVYHKQFYASNTSEFIGATIGYEYHLRDINPYVSPYLLFNSQYANMRTMYRIVTETATSGSVRTTETAGPFHVSENTIGIGLTVKLTERFSLNQSGGIGSAFFQKQSTGKWDWEVMFQWRAGLSFMLN